MNDLKKFVSYLESRGVLNNKYVKKAFLNVDRRYFVLEKYQDIAYSDEPFPTLQNQTISQPYTVAYMLDLLSAKPGEKVLDIGSGSGWTTALLADIAGKKGHVYAIERIEELKEYGEENTRSLGYDNTSFFSKNAADGLKEYSPFDKILVSASAEKIPSRLVDQLKSDGRLVIPLRDQNNNIILIEKKKDKLHKEYHPGFVFVPFIEE